MEPRETREKLQFCLTDLVRGQRTMAEALTLAVIGKDHAESIASHLLFDYTHRIRSTPSSPPWVLADFLWKLCGATQCLEHVFLAHHGYLGEFLCQKLRDEPDTYSDNDLVFLQAKDAGFREPVEAVRRARQSAEIKTLDSQGVQFSNDIAEVKRRLSEYKFDPELAPLLEKVDDRMGNQGDAFDQAALLKHLRTFYEKVHEHVGVTLQNRKPETADKTPLASFGQAIDFLRRKEVLTQKMEAFAKALYGVLSNEGVHAIKSEREYVRLCRNMVAEYALVLFFELERQVGN